MLSSTLMMRPFVSLISTALLRRFEVATGARVDMAANDGPGVGGGLPRVQSPASLRHMGRARISCPLAASHSFRVLSQPHAPCELSPITDACSRAAAPSN